MRQCKLKMIKKNNKKILYLLDLKIWGLKRCSFDLIYLNIKKDFDYLSFTSQWPNNSERL
jgi:hypothetical protein